MINNNVIPAASPMEAGNGGSSNKNAFLVTNKPTIDVDNPIPILDDLYIKNSNKGGGYYISNDDGSATKYSFRKCSKCKGLDILPEDFKKYHVRLLLEYFIIYAEKCLDDTFNLGNTLIFVERYCDSENEHKLNMVVLSGSPSPGLVLLFDKTHSDVTRINNLIQSPDTIDVMGEFNIVIEERLTAEEFTTLKETTPLFHNGQEVIQNTKEGNKMSSSLIIPVGASNTNEKYIITKRFLPASSLVIELQYGYLHKIINYFMINYKKFVNVTTSAGYIDIRIESRNGGQYSFIMTMDSEVLLQFIFTPEDNVYRLFSDRSDIKVLDNIDIALDDRSIDTNNDSMRGAENELKDVIETVDESALSVGKLKFVYPAYMYNGTVMSYLPLKDETCKSYKMTLRNNHGNFVGSKIFRTEWFRQIIIYLTTDTRLRYMEKKFVIGDAEFNIVNGTDVDKETGRTLRVKINDVTVAKCDFYLDNFTLDYIARTKIDEVLASLFNVIITPVPSGENVVTPKASDVTPATTDKVSVDEDIDEGDIKVSARSKYTRLIMFQGRFNKGDKHFLNTIMGVSKFNKVIAELESEGFVKKFEKIKYFDDTDTIIVIIYYTKPEKKEGNE